jgi:hypothetical protein
MAWAVGPGEVDVAVGQTPGDLLAFARPTATLGERAVLGRTIGDFGTAASFAAVFAPPGCCASDSPASAPAAFGWGRRASDGWAELTVGDELLGQFIGSTARP